LFEIRDDRLVQKAEALMKQALDGWGGVRDQGKKDAAFKLIVTEFLKRVPLDYLQFMADQIEAQITEQDQEECVVEGVAEADVAVADDGYGEYAAGEGYAEENYTEASYYDESVGAEAEAAYAEAGYAEEEAAVEEVVEAEAMEVSAEEAVAEAEEVVLGMDAPSQQAAEKLLSQIKRLKEPQQFARVWPGYTLRTTDQQLGVVAALLQIWKADDEGQPEICANFIMEVLKAKSLKIEIVTQALQAVAARLEHLVQANETHWHMHSYMLTNIFPKTPMTQWGWQHTQWTWISWWELTEGVLRCADPFRAFDVLVRR